MANKIINKILSYQNYNKLIINLSNESTNNHQIMNIDIGYLSETWKCTSTHTMPWHHLASKASLYSDRKRYYTVLQQKWLLNPTLTSLEEATWALFIQKIGDPAQGGANSKETNHCSWRRVNQCWSEAKLSLPINLGADWADTSTHRLTHQSTELPGEPTRVEERERAQFPIKAAEDKL